MVETKDNICGLLKYVKNFTVCWNWWFGANELGHWLFIVKKSIYSMLQYR